MAAVTLYHGLASTCSKKVRLSLYEKGVSFESRLLDLQKFEQHRPEYLAINPKGVVPTLVHEGNAIIESSNIIEYIDEAFAGPALSPESPAERSAMRLWLRFSDEEAYPAVAPPTWQYMRQRAAEKLSDGAVADTLANVPTTDRRERWARMAKGGYSDAELAEAFRKMGDCLDKLGDQLARTTWLIGDCYSLADIAMLPFVVRICNLQPALLEERGREPVAEWLERAGERPSFASAITFTDDPRAHELPNI